MAERVAFKILSIRKFALWQLLYLKLKIMFKHTLLLILLFTGLSNLGLATVYTTTGNNSWTPSTPGTNINSSDEFIINHSATLYGLSLESGGSITVNSGGELLFKWSASFKSGSSIYIAPNGELEIKQITLSNYSDDFVIDGAISTTNGTLANYQSGDITYNEGASWYLNQFTLVNYGTMTLNEDADWSNGTISFSLGTVEINKQITIKNLTLQNNASIVGYGQIDIVNGNATFSSNGFINGCEGQTCIPPSTVGSVTYLAASLGEGSTFVPYDGGSLPSSSCNTTVQALEDMTISADVKFSDLLVSPGVTVTIEADVTLEICNSVANEGIVYMENNASLVQTSVSDENKGDGVYKMERKASNSDSEYNSWSSPFKSLELSEVFSLSNPCDIYAFDPASQSWLYDYPNNYSTTCNGNNAVFTSPNLIPGADGIMDMGRGYFIPGLNVNVRTVIGEINNGDIEIDVYETSLGNKPLWNLDDWNLVGNPYPCAIDLDSFYAENSAVIGGSFYFWVDDKQNGTDYDQSEDYAVFSNNVGTEANGGVANRYVASAQAFWVYSLTDAPIKFTNAMRVTGNNTDLFKTDDNGDEVFVYLDITNDSSNFNQCAVGFNTTATNDYDLESDAPKGDAGTGVTIASLIDGNPFSIQAFEQLFDNESYTVPLLVTTTNAAMHTVAASRFQNMGSNVLVSLKDNLTNVTTNLKLTDYSVYLDTGRYEGRFELIFENTGTALGVTDLEIESGFMAYQLHDQIAIQLTNKDEVISRVFLYDLMGKEIVEERNISTNSLELPVSHLNSGVYLVKCVLRSGEEYTTKVSFIN